MKKGEKPFIKVSNSRKIYIPIYLMIIILFLFLVYMEISNNEIHPFSLKLALIFAFVCIAYTEIHRFGNSYEIDSNSFVYTKGILNKKSKKVDFSAISDFEIIQSLWQRIFSYGTIEIRLFSKDSTTYVKNINNPFKFTDVLEEQLIKVRGGGFNKK